MELNATQLYAFLLKKATAKQKEEAAEAEAREKELLDGNKGWD